jgi:hypothetical protein
VPVAEVIGRRLNVPVLAKSGEEAPKHFRAISKPEIGRSSVQLDPRPSDENATLICGALLANHETTDNHDANPAVQSPFRVDVTGGMTIEGASPSRARRHPLG